MPLLNFLSSLLEQVFRAVVKYVWFRVSDEAPRTNEAPETKALPSSVSAFDKFSFYPMELFGTSKSIEPNIAQGPYRSAEHYIQTHLELLKIDFESRLKAGVALHLEDLTARNPDIWVYSGVTVNASNEKKNVWFKVTLSPGDFDQSEWEKSNRFLHGSMVLITREKFKVFHVAIIKDRGSLESDKNRTDNECYIYVEFVMTPPRHNQYGQYLLIEPKTFFEPYHQVMMALASFYKTGLPMERYLVHVDTTPRYPRYVTSATEYTIDRSVVRLSKGTGWPSAASMKLNESQRSAIVGALTQELTLIQGPPGTGKTHTAYKMIKYLLDNNKFSSPILVVCFKNHSLDQLLERLFDQGVKLRRMGGQSKSEKLKELNLTNVHVGSSMPGVFKQLKYVETMQKDNANKLHSLCNLLKTNLVEIELQKAMKQRFWLNEHHRELKDMLKFRRIAIDRPQVLGITTSGAAAHHRILEKIAPPVVIVEEAAEVLESHIVASISKSCQHLILIGDHQQLKPSTASHLLAQKYHMDVSLFERMVHNGARCDVLTVQHRMRPEISALICPSIYPNLVDHPSVSKYPNVPGVTKNVLFFHHTHFEEVASDSESRFNRFEANFALALCSYLLKQETYMKNPGRITILTAYKEQERYMMQARGSHHRLGLELPPEVVITSVDNYQGQENDVIILSLVRNNPQGKVGFLATKNRVCVALSRAKHGLYILGNADNLVKKKSSIWHEISDVLRSQRALVDDIPLKCQIHGNMTFVKTAKEILALKNGGCRQTCTFQHGCGHICNKTCHGYDLEHKSMFRCQVPCMKKCTKGHLCPKVCSVKCPPCPVTVRKELPCLHLEDVPCHELPTNYHCKKCVLGRN